ncbi:CoA ester lyase [Alphaproteobacteria bacterium KMM 3653]|uniref:CoA ester lyase n=1 Tax=Harenicola maris TaxID=2841044 RepID=A0AAP2CQ72_9RHOB|nr:CoA ester lyase [Harenicola maris]
MTQSTRPFRSVLYLPASNARALAKAATLPCDAIIFDLEDAVAEAEKPAARTALGETLASTDYGPRFRIVRINGADTPWGEDDLNAAAQMAPEAVLLPKVESAAQVEAAFDRLPEGVRVWAMMETPLGMLKALEIAQARGMGGFVMGTNDLAKDLNTRFRPDRLPMMHGLQSCLTAARAAGIICIDGVYNAFKDTEGLRAECDQGRDLGMDGKSLIHPAQVEIANAVFGPTEEELDLARRMVAAFAEAQAEGKGVAVLDGRIVENLHVATAQATLAKAEAIATLEGA